MCQRKRAPLSLRKIKCNKFLAEYIESDKFFVSAHGMDLEWQLCLYPSGKDCEDEEHVSILLELVSRLKLF